MKLHGSSIAVLHSFCNRKTTVGGIGVFPRWAKGGRVLPAFFLIFDFVNTDLIFT